MAQHIPNDIYENVVLESTGMGHETNFAKSAAGRQGKKLHALLLQLGYQKACSYKDDGEITIKIDNFLVLNHLAAYLAQHGIEYRDTQNTIVVDKTDLTELEPADWNDLQNILAKAQTDNGSPRAETADIQTPESRATAKTHLIAFLNKRQAPTPPAQPETAIAKQRVSSQNTTKSSTSKVLPVIYPLCYALAPYCQGGVDIALSRVTKSTQPVEAQNIIVKQAPNPNWLQSPVYQNLIAALKENQIPFVESITDFNNNPCYILSIPTEDLTPKAMQLCKIFYAKQTKNPIPQQDHVDAKTADDDDLDIIRTKIAKLRQKKLAEKKLKLEQEAQARDKQIRLDGILAAKVARTYQEIQEKLDNLERHTNNFMMLPEAQRMGHLMDRVSEIYEAIKQARICFEKDQTQDVYQHINAAQKHIADFNRLIAESQLSVETSNRGYGL